ncbi:MAG: hypothetical protein ABI878_03675 [Acidobacteriota bacterium]
MTRSLWLIFSLGALLLTACQKDAKSLQGTIPATLAEVPSARFNFRYEADVPAPDPTDSKIEERSAAIQADFDQTRPQEVLDKTLPSPDKKHYVAVYHRPSDVGSEYRLDMYTSDGKLLRKITPDALAIHFPDTIVWAPDSSTVAFVGMVRAGQDDSGSAPINPSIAPENAIPANTAETADTNTNSNSNTATASTPAPPTSVLAFRTEQLYTCGTSGENTKPLTQNEGLIYFYYAWSPDSSMLVALASTSPEWQIMQSSAEQKGENFTPAGRPRVIEKNGRERRLDDAATTVRPVWSPDSAKVSDAFGNQVRIYDTGGINPTQAAIPLRNQLLISSQAFDRDQQRKLQNTNSIDETNAAANVAPEGPQSATTLPDEKTLASFNPIVELDWTADNILFLRTAYVKRMKNDADSVTSFARWHRLIFSYQP